MKKHLLSFSLLYSIAAISFAQIVATDYSVPGNWAAHPMKGSGDMAFDPSYTYINTDTSIKTYTHVAYDATSGFDIFAVYATTVPVGACTISSSPAQNFPVTDPCHRLAATLIIQNEFTQFSRFGRMYVPFYRQASLATFSTPPTSLATQAAVFDTAVTDVLAAFQYYMQHNNNGKRVILLGHSQGANVLSMMLRKLEANPGTYPYINKIFLAVLAGYEAGPAVTKNQTKGGWLQNFPVCQHPADTACICTWGLHRYGMTWNSIPALNKVAYNTNFVTKQYLYSTIDTSTQEVLNDPLVYTNSLTTIGGTYFPDNQLYFPRSNYYNISSGFVYYTNMYRAENSKPDALDYGLLIDTVTAANDYRYDPMLSASGSDLHVYDMFLAMGDIINLVAQKINSVPHSVGIKEIGGVEMRVEIYPNPADDKINIALENMKIEHLQILNVLGEEVAMGENLMVTGTYSIDIKDLPNGVYFIRLENGEASICRKFVHLRR